MWKHADYYAVVAQLVALAAVAIAVELRSAPNQSFRSRVLPDSPDPVYYALGVLFTGLAVLSVGLCLYALATLSDTPVLRVFALPGVATQAVLMLRLWIPAALEP